MIPKNIFLMWDKPRPEWPLSVSFCINLWLEMNPDFNVEIFDGHDARALVKDDFDMEIYDSLKVQHQSDIVRTKLLAERGGIWVDATCMPHRPARLWIDQFSNSDFAGLKSLTKGQVVDNWFMVSQKSSILMSKQYTALQRYWSTPKINLPQDPRSIAMISDAWRLYVTDLVAHELKLAPYFIWHYIFRSLLEDDAEFAAIFMSQIYTSSDGGCGFVALTMAKSPGAVVPLPDDIKNHIIHSASPLSKLIRWNKDTESVLSELRHCVQLRADIEGF